MNGDLSFLLENDSPKKSTKSTALIVFGTVIGGLTVAVTAISTPFVFPFFRRICLPYVPATNEQVSNVLKALKGRSGSLVDLGSGDGRIVIAAAQQGFDSTGIELNPWLVIYSKISALYSGLYKKVKFHRHDLWKFDLKPYNNVVIFGVETMLSTCFSFFTLWYRALRAYEFEKRKKYLIMEELEEKFKKELKSDAWIIACRFPLNNLKPVKIIGIGIDTVWIYQMDS